MFLAAVVSIVVLRLHRGPVRTPSVPTAVHPAAVRVKAVGRKTIPVAHTAGVVASAAVAVVCGDDPATADRYEARNDALRSIARRRDLPRNDVALLMAYVGATNDVLRAERVAALKNDVLNLLRSQEPVPDGLAELLVGMSEADEGETGHPPAVLDYCLQHLGALLGEIADAAA